MSKKQFIFPLFFVCHFILAQQKEPTLNNEIKTDVPTSVVTEPVEGITSFYTNLQKRIIIPEFIEEGGYYKTRVSFIVNEDGSLTDYKIVTETPFSIGLGNQVIKILKTFPNWKPSDKKSTYILPVTIYIEETVPEPKSIKK